MTSSPSLTTGKIRGLQQCATGRGVFSILAMDHRNNLRRSLNSDSPGSVLDQELVEFKQDVVLALAPFASAMLLDPEYGAVQSIRAGVLPGSTGLIAALERTSYTGEPTARQSELLSDWSPARARSIGASAVKLLVYYHPDSSMATQIESLVAAVGQDCIAADIALFLEPLTYSVDPAVSRLGGDARRRAVVETTRRLSAIPGVDVMKVEFPLDISAEEDEREWVAACEELSEASSLPWVLLSAGVSFETYLRQVVAAARAGASGVAVGRAVWKEAAGISRVNRREFLATVARDRMARVTALCDALAVPWTSRLPRGTAGREQRNSQ